MPLSGNTDLISNLPAFVLFVTALLILLLKSTRVKAPNLALWLVAVTGVVIALITTPGTSLLASLTDDQAYSINRMTNPGFLSTVGNGLIIIILLLGLLFDYRDALSRHNLGTVLSLALIATAGAVSVSSASHLVIIILGIEIVFLPLIAFSAFDHYSPLSRKAAITYLVPGLLATGLIIFGTALYYLGSGTFSTSGLVVPHEGGLVFSIGSLLVIVALLLKGVFIPFLSWKPLSRAESSLPGLYSGLLAVLSGTAVMILLIRLVPRFILDAGADNLGPVLLAIALVSILAGNFLAFREVNVNRIVAFLGVAHVGYMLIGLLAFRPDATGAVLFYLMLWGPSLLTAFYLVSHLSSDDGRGELAGIIGAGFRFPLPAAVLVFILLSIAGLPPSAGFLGGILIFLGAVHAELIPPVVFALLLNLVGTFCCLRIIVYLYMKRLFALKPLGTESHVGFPALVGYLFTGLAVLGVGISPAALLYTAYLAINQGRF